MSITNTPNTAICNCPSCRAQRQAIWANQTVAWQPNSTYITPLPSPIEDAPDHVLVMEMLKRGYIIQLGRDE